MTQLAQASRALAALHAWNAAQAAQEAPRAIGWTLTHPGHCAAVQPSPAGPTHCPTPATRRARLDAGPMPPHLDVCPAHHAQLTASGDLAPHDQDDHQERTP